jgi:hypothetical protein
MKNTRGKNVALSGRLLLSLVFLGTIAAFIVFQWNTTQVFNSAWHPHARFHAVQLAGFITAMSLIALWLIWRHYVEPRIATRIAAIVPLIFWSGEFYALLIPGTSPAFDLNNPNTFELSGIVIYFNLLFSGVMIVLTILGYWLTSHRWKQT